MSIVRECSFSSLCWLNFMDLMLHIYACSLFFCFFFVFFNSLSPFLLIYFFSINLFLLFILLLIDFIIIHSFEFINFSGRLEEG